jgi:hypothetical protein
MISGSVNKKARVLLIVFRRNVLLAFSNCAIRHTFTNNGESAKLKEDDLWCKRMKQQPRKNIEIVSRYPEVILR